MEYCKNCLQPDTRPNTRFSDKLCPACAYYLTLPQIDWEARNKELKEIIDYGKSNMSKGYDCIIGVSGGKDSTRQAIYVREKLNMNPLLVCLAAPPQQITERGVHNISNLINKGFDCITINPAPNIWRELMKYCFYNYLNPFKSTELALYGSVPRIAITYQIPLIWWGENDALQIGETTVMGKTGSDGNNLRKLNTLGDGDISWILKAGFKEKNIQQYKFPTEEEIERGGIRTVFLGYFWKDWSLVNNGNYSALRGLDIRKDKPWEMGEHIGVTALDEDWTPMNQMIKYLKFGFGRTTEYINEDIRAGIISRDEGIKIVEEFDGKCSEKYIHSFCNYINIEIDEFWEVVENGALNKELFTINSKGDYSRKYKVGYGL